MFVYLLYTCKHVLINCWVSVLFFSHIVITGTVIIKTQLDGTNTEHVNLLRAGDGHTNVDSNQSEIKTSLLMSTWSCDLLVGRSCGNAPFRGVAKQLLLIIVNCYSIKCNWWFNSIQCRDVQLNNEGNFVFGEYLVLFSQEYTVNRVLPKKMCVC